ncbi:recombinase RecT [Lapidilactobacillus dextrinicus]|uniref:recombinase RecT n=1 Tax=Lapidilactobacillus dextrinicus TaxID=51664 RepID=UPI003F23DEFE
MANLAKVPVKQLLETPTMKNKFQDVLNDRAPQFMSSLTNISQDQGLRNVDQMSIISSAMIAATLNLPIEKNLGYAYIVPYKGQGQFQMGYKGYIQLAQRSGQYKSLNAIAVYADEFKSWNPLTEELNYTPNFHDRDPKEQPVGYCTYFKLINGFEKFVYWTREQVDQHRRKFSKMSGGEKPKGVWADQYDAMALKTVIKNLLSKWGPLTVDMQKAIVSDDTTPENDTQLKDVTPDEQPTSIDDLLENNQDPQGQPGQEDKDELDPQKLAKEIDEDVKTDPTNIFENPAD